MPRISVIIPAYNGVARFLEQAIRSVLTQTFADRELIVVDDASSDDTGRLVLRFPQGRYFRRPENGGQAAARNDGARLASGEFLAFLDQDDLWEATFLAETLAGLDQNPQAAVIHADGYQVSESNQILEYDGAMKHTSSVTQLLRGGHDVATSGSLFRKTSFDAVGGYDTELRVWEDIDLAIRLYRRYPVLYLPRPLYRHRLYDRNVSRQIPSESALLARRRFLERYTPVCSSDPALANTLARDWACYYGDLGKWHLHEGHVSAARAAFFRSIRHHPQRLKAILRFLRSLIKRG